MPIQFIGMIQSHEVSEILACKGQVADPTSAQVCAQPTRLPIAAARTITARAAVICMKNGSSA